MEILFRQIPCLLGVGAGTTTTTTTYSLNLSSVRLRVNDDYGGGKWYGALNRGRGRGRGGFSDKGHLQYYYGGGRICGGCKKDKDKDLEEKVTIKKKLKLLKGLSKDMSLFSDLGLSSQVQGKILSETAETLLEQLQLLRAEEKELKKKRKHDKAQLKAVRLQTMLDCESSSSSSESSDSECEEVIDMTHLRTEANTLLKPMLSDLQQPGTQEATTLALAISMTHEVNTTKETCFEDRGRQIIEQECGSGSSSSCSIVSGNGRSDESGKSLTGAWTKRIEVCMGKKCKMSGGVALLEEFERVMGVEGGVVGCKCMGQCRDGPNVRVLNSVNGIGNEGLDDSVRTPANPLCIGVSLEDVGVIMANFFGDDRNYEE
ncbi:hypothetical protein CFOL_v3_28777 [Cephalotus follicularis]|uniref:Uncharacterized protein n=1 Tax=Cephalotus follicularis TaxID=3775 RepID=A0A1Q3CYQ0_CEPFO|nr:hypothetical protein CFOL_v3_28777 [Cephalotus follicularis]